MFHYNELQMNTNQNNRISAPPPAVADASRKKPVHELRLGLIKAAIWENTVGDNLRYNVTFARIYKNKPNGRPPTPLAGMICWSWPRWPTRRIAGSALPPKPTVS